MNSVLALDLGATSGRAVLGCVRENALVLKEIYRFDNYMEIRDEGLFWDIKKIFAETKTSIAMAYQEDSDFQSIGIDTWGVDFGLIDQNGHVLGDPRCYRDTYTQDIFRELVDKIGVKELFRRTGIQALPINTLFQLAALKKLGGLEKADKLLLMPDLLNFMLTGEKASELSIASTTQLIGPRKNIWAQELLELLSIPLSLFTEIVPAGRILGSIKKELAEELGIPGKKVINVAAHDTACAAYCFPDHESVYFLSSGTWSLLGVMQDEPIINDHLMTAGFSNEKGAQGETLLLKNITGLWLIEEARRYYKTMGHTYSYAEISGMALAQEASGLGRFFFDTDLPELSEPGDIPLKLQAYAELTNQKIPQSPAEIFSCIYENLAYKYKHTVDLLEQSTGIKRDSFYIVGGGSNAEILCRYTADVSGLGVRAGLSEATAMGNVMIQLQALKLYEKPDLEKMAIKSHSFREYKPEDQIKWKQNYQKYVLKMEE